MKLTNKKCIPCEGGIPPLNEDEILEYITLVKGWVEDKNKKIQKNFKY